MARKTGGARRKTRSKLKKPLRKKGKISIRRYLQKFAIGQMVAMVPEPAIHKAMPPRRTIGRMGRVVGIRGECYEVLIKDGHLDKIMVVHPVHMKGRGVKKA